MRQSKSKRENAIRMLKRLEELEAFRKEKDPGFIGWPQLSGRPVSERATFKYSDAPGSRQTLTKREALALIFQRRFNLSPEAAEQAIDKVLAATGYATTKVWTRLEVSLSRVGMPPYEGVQPKRPLAPFVKAKKSPK